MKIFVPKNFKIFKKLLKAFVTFDCSASTTTAGAVLAALSASTASKVEGLVKTVLDCSANLEPKKHNIVIERSKMIQKRLQFCHSSLVLWSHMAEWFFIKASWNRTVSLGVSASHPSLA